MRKTPIFAGLAALALAVPAQAHEHPGKPPRSKVAKPGKCDQTGFTPVITVRRVQFKAAKPATP